MDTSLILLVDDQPRNLQVLGSLLEGTYSTAVAEHGAEAGVLNLTNPLLKDYSRC